MSQPIINVGILGAAGYTGGELLRLLLQHPAVRIACAVSASQADKPITSVHTDLVGETEMRFSQQLCTGLDVIFLCVNHGQASQFLSTYTPDAHTKVIDLSNEFRIAPKHTFREMNFQYGLPALYTPQIKTAQYIANPGCFATCIELSLLPLAKRNLLPGEVHIHAVTGSTGAGVSHTATSHFSWRSGNVSFYKEFTHQHLDEINQTLLVANERGAKSPRLFFLPMRGNFTRGILSGAYFVSDHSQEQIKTIYQDFYAESDPFVFISDEAISLKQVVNTNKCLIHIQKIDDTVLVTAIIDNLLKGASGQAVQNMNLMFGLPQDEGLRIKPLAM